MISLENITKNYRDVKLFSNLSQQFDAGLIYAIVGGNGSGKSVLLRLIAGFAKPEEGVIWIRGERLGEKHDFISEAGISIDQPEFVGHWTGLDNLMYLANIRGIATTEEILNLAPRLDLTDALGRRYRTYSQGMRQKMRIIQALMEHPTILLMDEPFTALDEDTTDEVIELFKTFRSPDRLIIFTSHDREIIEQLADVIISMRELKGRQRLGE